MLPVSVLAGLLGTRLIISSLGSTLFGVCSLIITLQLIFVFLDLGTGAAVLNEAARFRVHGDHPRLLDTWARARRASTSACLVLLAVTVALAAFDAWPAVLGVRGVADVNLAVTTVVLVNVVARPAMLSLQALQGFGHSVTVVLLQISIPLVGLVVVVIGALLDASLVVFSASVVCGQLVCGLVGLTLIHRRHRLPVLWPPVPPDGPHRVRLRSQAGPMLVINVVAPLGSGLDRVALAHRSTSLDLAMYAIVAQLMQPAFSLSATLLQSLWGDFSRKRSEHTLRWATIRGTFGLIAAGAVVAFVGYAIATPWVADLLSGGTIPISYGVSALAGTYVLMSLLLTVPSALLTDARGLTAQAKVLLVTVAVNLAITWALSPAWGVVAPLVGTVVAMMLQGGVFVGLSRRYLQEPTVTEAVT
jgi:O-antigen/teichoic acid export membrane protein